MKRYLSEYIKNDDESKMILLSGPRQCGKTTLSKNIFSSFDYFNYDSEDDRASIKNKHWRRDVQAILLDEIHKMPSWKEWLKGVYDTEKSPPRLFVTGSAKLETFRKVGDSLAGRYFHYHLYPLDIQELVKNNNMSAEEAFSSLMRFSGFPEPLLKGNDRFFRRWQKTHLDIILRQDFLDLFSVQSIKKIEILTSLIKSCVGSSVSYASLARDLASSPPSVKQWIDHLQSVYAIFAIYPYHKNIGRSLLKEPKLYFFDITRAKDEGSRLENLVALTMLKHLHKYQDIEGHSTSLHYMRTKDGVEIDFVLCVDEDPILCIEVKSSDDKPSKSFSYIKRFIDIPSVQLVLNLKRQFETPEGVKVLGLIPFLETFNIKDWVISKN